MPIIRPKDNILMKSKDRLRTLIRRVINERIYEMAANILNAVSVIVTQGVRTFYILYSSPKYNEAYRSVIFRGYDHPIKFRPGTSDVDTLVQNIVRGEYGQLPKDLNPKIIIDGGAYIGDVSLYFINRFKNCFVFAIEPNKESYSLAEVNLKKYPERVKLIKKGLWSNETKLGLVGKFTGARIVNTNNTVDSEVECIGVDTVLTKYNIDMIDILKLDVEGAEKQILLENSGNWLKYTQIIIVEFHGNDIKKECETFLQERGFIGHTYRNLNYFYNSKLVRGKI
jgi:FkbM family methyltransferase